MEKEDLTAKPELRSIGADPSETRAEMTKHSARGYAKVRHVLVQNASEPRPSLLGTMVHERRHRALLLYLLLLTCWPWLNGRRKPLEADVWIRALTVPEERHAPTWSASTLSRAWRDLEQLKLIEPRARAGRLVAITPRREDGKKEYKTPVGERDWLSAYFTLPDAFWNANYFAKLRMPGLAMLLIVAKETSNKREMWLPYDQAQDWYGLSSKTCQNGLKELDNLGLLHKRRESIKAPLSKIGITIRMHYSLTGDFGYEARSAMKTQAAKARAKREQSAAVVDARPPKKRTGKTARPPKNAVSSSAEKR